MAHLTRPAEVSGVSAGLFPETAAGNRAYQNGGANFWAEVVTLKSLHRSCKRPHKRVSLDIFFY